MRVPLKSECPIDKCFLHNGKIRADHCESARIIRELLCCFFLGNLLGETGFIFAEHIVHHAFVDQNRFWRGRRSKNQFCAGIGFSVGNSGANAVGVIGEGATGSFVITLVSDPIKFLLDSKLKSC